MQREESLWTRWLNTQRVHIAAGDILIAQLIQNRIHNDVSRNNGGSSDDHTDDEEGGAHAQARVSVVDPD